MKNWKVVKPQQVKKAEKVLRKGGSKFKCAAVLVGIIAVVYGLVLIGVLSMITERVYGIAALQPIFTNEYFVLAKRTVELIILRVELLVLKACAISRKVLCSVCAGTSLLLQKVPGYSKVQSAVNNCKYCQCARGFAVKVGGYGKSLLDSVLGKIKELRSRQ